MRNPHMGLQTNGRTQTERARQMGLSLRIRTWGFEHRHGLTPNGPVRNLALLSQVMSHMKTMKCGREGSRVTQMDLVAVQSNQLAKQTNSKTGATFDFRLRETSTCVHQTLCTSTIRVPSLEKPYTLRTAHVQSNSWMSHMKR